jgi:hypothetical protein
VPVEPAHPVREPGRQPRRNAENCDRAAKPRKPIQDHERLRLAAQTFVLPKANQPSLYRNTVAAIRVRRGDIVVTRSGPVWLAVSR